MAVPSVVRTTTIAVAIALLWSGAEARDCYSCSGEDCVKVATAGTIVTCTNTDDLCYTRFDPTSLLATERGCLTLATVATCTGDECVSCATDDLCNELGHPQHRCASCSSVSDAQCVTNPAGLTDTQCGAASSVDLTAAQCYSRVIGSVTERGCIASQSDVDWCSGADCVTCVGAGCNKEEFPANRQQCVDCENADTCDTDTATATICDDPYDVCVTLKRANGAVRKACEKALPSSDATYCQANPAQCAFCGKKLCNGAVFAVGHSVAGNEKSCYRCEGTGCQQARADLATCRLFDDDCFSSFSGFNPSRRDCMSELTVSEQRSCREAESSGSTDCATCSESQCNLVSRADHRCAYCTSLVDDSCTAPDSGPLPPLVQCPAPSTEILPDAQCYTRVVGSSTERGCISAASDLLGCSADGRTNCATCGIEADGQGCNTQVFPSDRRRCTIGRTANEYCPDPWDDCVQLLQSGIRRRTCRSLLTATERTFCTANSNRCMFCATDNCNAAEQTFDYVECLSCDSATDVRCATNPAALGSYTRCASCASAIVADTIRRGCLASMPAEVSAQCTTVGTSATCQRCSTNRCNRGNFPTTRLQCYRCTEPPCVSHQAVRLAYCPAYRANDSCILQTDVSGQLLRLDCASSLSEAELSVCSVSAALCQTCSTSGCNDPMVRGTSGSCVQCRNATNPLCRSNAESVPAEPCANPTNAVCYSRLVDVGGTVGDTERGCMADLSVDEQSACTRGDNCLVCNSLIANCNTAQYPVAPLKCFQCDSRTDGASCKAAQVTEAPECPTYNTGNKCYTLVQSNGDTIRKCSMAAFETECASTSGSCEQCLFSGCNSKASTDVGITVAPVVTTTPGPGNGTGRSLRLEHCLLMACLCLAAWTLANTRKT